MQEFEVTFPRSTDCMPCQCHAASTYTAMSSSTSQGYGKSSSDITYAAAENHLFENSVEFQPRIAVLRSHPRFCLLIKLSSLQILRLWHGIQWQTMHSVVCFFEG